MIALRFVTSQPPENPVRLSLGICSFNRPENAAAVLRSLSSDAASAISTLIIVEQGEHVLDDADVNDVVVPKTLNVVRVRQDNFGGAGGFTRSICEVIHRAETQENGPTHHIMMDDDAVAHPDQWNRIAAFFAFCRQDTAVGGPMLEMETPWRLQEAGVLFPETRRRLSLGRGLDVRKPATLEMLAAGASIEAHGWWCWGAPISAYKRGGAPLNLFIKYDDIEYTYRLKQIGIPTTVLPGAAVWHEAFSHKPADWRVYYTLRNETIFQALHNPTPAWRWSPVWNSILPLVLRHEPVSAHLAIDAVNDFLRGPDHALPPNPAAFHTKIMARYHDLLAQYDPLSQTTGLRTSTSHWLTDWRTAWTRVDLFAKIIACQIRFFAFRRQAQAAWRAHLQSEPGRERHASYSAWQRLFGMAR